MAVIRIFRVCQCQGVQKRHGKPSERPQPEILRKPGLLVSPEHLPLRIIRMIIKSCYRILLVFLDIKKLRENILVIFPVMKAVFVFQVIRLRHIQAVKPYLMWINLLVPEVSLLCTRHLKYLLIDICRCLCIFFLSGQIVQCK